VINTVRIRYALVTCAAVLALTACSGPRSEPGNAGGYTPGQTYDAEDYAGPAQQVTGHDHEDAEYDTRSKRVADGTETYCKTRKNGRCTSSGTRTKYKNVPERYEKDDEDWYLVLADGTRVDVEQGDQARYPVGVTYP
jgi:hypothetical protein